MALDRSDDDADEPGEARPELHLQRARTGGEAHAAHREPAETRSRAEYYEALRAADGRSEQGNDKHGGWETVDAEKRPPLDSIRAPDERIKHILDGDSTDSGGHRHGTGNPGKTEFPASWDDKKIMDNILDVARRPDQPPIYQHWNQRWLVRGTREEVEIAVVITEDGRIWSGWPRVGGPGVVKNPKET